MTADRTIGLVGTGVIGTGWALRVLARGHRVIAWDPAEGAEGRLRDAISRGWPSVTRLGLFPGADPGQVRIASSLEELAATSDFIQESAPESKAVKQPLLHQLAALAPRDTVIASSSSGLVPTVLQQGCRHPERILVGHPSNPVHLIPLVEIVAGDACDPDAVATAVAHYNDLAMQPLVFRHEIEGLPSVRLQEAMRREILRLVNEGVATTAELEDAIVYGPGLRWAGMGSDITIPANGRSVAELETGQDDYLLALMRALRPLGVGAGRLVAEREARILAAGNSHPWRPGSDVPSPLDLYRGQVEPDWVDYNGHMTEAAFLTAFGWASDCLFRYIGIDETYRQGGHSFYTVETHINYQREAALGDPLRITTQLLGVDDKRLHFFHAMYHDQAKTLLCTTEQMLLHVDMNANRVSSIEPGPAEALGAIVEAHADLPCPDQVGRRIHIT